MSNYEIQYLKIDDNVTVTQWLDSLDSSIRRRINQRITRIIDGNFGDYKKIDSEISELRFKFGSGYRIYYHQHGNTIILLINGGDKSTQSKDIEKAKRLLNEWRSING